jgi:hypothetical protein
MALVKVRVAVTRESLLGRLLQLDPEMDLTDSIKAVEVEAVIDEAGVNHPDWEFNISTIAPFITGVGTVAGHGKISFTVNMQDGALTIESTEAAKDLLLVLKVTTENHNHRPV